MSNGWDAHVRRMTEELGADLAAIGENGAIWGKSGNFNLTPEEFQLLCKVARGYTPSGTETLSAGGIPLMMLQADEENGVKLVSKKCQDPVMLCSVVPTQTCVVVALKSGAKRKECVAICLDQASYLKEKGF